MSAVASEASAIANLLYDDESEWGKGPFVYTKEDEPHICVYDTNKPIAKSKNFFTEVEYHTDNSTLTWLLALSGDEDYSGGGTFFEDAKKRVELRRGQMIVVSSTRLMLWWCGG